MKARAIVIRFHIPKAHKESLREYAKSKGYRGMRDCLYHEGSAALEAAAACHRFAEDLKKHSPHIYGQPSTP